MPFIDIGSDARGVIAIGEQATGVIAIGQVACGVIAIGQMAFGFVAVGQLARGVFVLGQLAIGVFTIGQVALGAHTCFAQLGVAGRRGKGIVLTLFPDRKPFAGVDTPQLMPLRRLQHEAPGFEAWLAASISEDGSISSPEGQRAPIHASPPLQTRLAQIAKSPWPKLWLHLRVEHKFAEATSTYREASNAELSLDLLQIRQPPRPPQMKDGFYAKATIRSLALALLLACWGVATLHGLASHYYSPKSLPAGLEWLEPLLFL